MTDIPFYKIRAVLKSAWTLEEAAYYLAGYNPDISNFEISVEAPNTVSQCYLWLKAHDSSLKNLNTITQTMKEKLPARYNVDQILNLMQRHTKDHDEDLHELRQQVSSGEITLPATIRAFYRGVAEIVWEMHTGFFKDQVAEILTNLPAKIAEKYQIKLEAKTCNQISEFLKGLSPHDKGAPSKQAKVKADVDWPKVLENI